MKALRIRIQLQEPVLATQPNAGEANSANSYGYIPGSMLRGAVVRAYCQKHPGVDIAADVLAHKLFFDGQVRYLNAYITTLDGQRMLPTPLSWYVDKDDADKKDADIFDFSVEINAGLSKPKSPKGEFCLLKGSDVILSDPVRQVSIHNASEERGRKVAGSSQVFRYEALAAGQIFACVIISEDYNLLEEIQQTLGEAMFLGGSHTGGYGSVRVTYKLDETDWHECEMLASASRIRITCMSDVILPAKGSSLLETLADELGLTRVDEISDAYYQICSVGGFNRTWGLPLPQSWAIQAGSTFCLTLGAKIDIEGLQTSGIGERRLEGFGRVAVNWQAQEKVHRKSDEFLAVQPIPLSASSANIAQGMAGRLLKAQLERKLVELLARNREFTELPSASQLNRVRVLAQQALLTGEAGVIKQHFDEMKSAKKTWERAKVDGKALVDWLVIHSTMQADTLRTVFELGDMLPQIAGQPAKLSAEILKEFSARLVDGVMKHAVEEKRSQEGR